MHNENVKSTLQRLPIHVSEYPKQHSNAGQTVTLHYHDEIEFVVIYDGSFLIEADGEKHIANSGDVVFVGSGVPHSTVHLTPSLVALIQFRENDFLSSGITRIIKYSVKYSNLSGERVRIIKNPLLFDSLTRLITEAEAKNPAYEMFARSEIYKVLGLLYRDGILVDTERFFATKEVQKILPALEYINKSYAENISLDSVSSLLGFDSSYFCRIFKEATGATFTEYLNFVRICKAEKLLSTTDMSILEISEAVGFASISYFNRVFKRVRNVSPGKYRLAKYVNIYNKVENRK